jgi:hypothetical protein
VLRSVRELEQFRVRTADAQPCGRIKDVYFHDSSWRVKHLVLSIEPSRFGRKEVLIEPGHITGLNDDRTLDLSFLARDLEPLPLASSVLPVCKQYEALAYASPGAWNFAAGSGADPHLRSAKAVFKYDVALGREFTGRVADLVYESTDWEIRYLSLEHQFERKTISFHILPQAVERITWTTQRVVLRELQPVSISVAEERADVSRAAAA